MDSTQKIPLPVLGYAPDDIPKMTCGVVSRTRVFGDIRRGLLRAKKVGRRTIIEADEARRYLGAFPDRLMAKRTAP
jgi:hypothetical protein